MKPVTWIYSAADFTMVFYLNIMICRLIMNRVHTWLKFINHSFYKNALHTVCVSTSPSYDLMRVWLIGSLVTLLFFLNSYEKIYIIMIYNTCSYFFYLLFSTCKCNWVQVLGFNRPQVKYRSGLQICDSETTLTFLRLRCDDHSCICVVQHKPIRNAHLWCITDQ